MKTGKQQPSATFSPTIQRKEGESGTRRTPPDHEVQTILQRRSVNEGSKQTSISQVPVQRMDQGGGAGEGTPLLINAEEQPARRRGLFGRIYNGFARAGRSFVGGFQTGRTLLSSAGGIIKDTANFVAHSGAFNKAKGISDAVGTVLTPAVNLSLGGASLLMSGYGMLKSGHLDHSLGQIPRGTYAPGSPEAQLLTTAREEAYSNFKQNTLGGISAGLGMIGGASTAMGGPIGAGVGMGALGLGALGAGGLAIWKSIRRGKRAWEQTKLDGTESRAGKIGQTVLNFLNPALRSMTGIKRKQLERERGGPLDAGLTNLLDHYEDFRFLGKRSPPIPGPSERDPEVGIEAGPPPFPLLDSDDDRSRDSDSDSPPPSQRPMRRVTEQVNGGPEAQVNPHAVVPLPTLPLHQPQQRPAPIAPLPETVVAPPQVVAPLPQPLPQPQPIPVQQPDPQAARIAEDMHKARSINFWNRPN